MGSSVRMKTLLVVLTAAAAVFAQDLGQAEEKDAPSSRYNCPMYDIDFYANDLHVFHGIPSWQECAQICNIASTSNCKFWSWEATAGCHLKSTDAGMRPFAGVVSGQIGCV